MKIYIFRHAQKDLDFTGNPDLTPKGKAQAESLVDKVLNHELPHPTQLWVSPKKRAQSTFRPLAKNINLKLHIHEGLTEQAPGENILEFHRRINGLFEEVKSKTNETIFLCTHYDWLVEALSLIPCDTDFSDSKYSHWSSGQHMGFELDEDGFFKFIGVYHLK